MAIELTAEKVQAMEDFHDKYYVFINDTRVFSSERKDPPEFAGALIETQAPIYEHILGKHIDYSTVTFEDVKRLAEHVQKDSTAYGKDVTIDEHNYKDVLIDMSRQSLKKVVEHTPNFDFVKPDDKGGATIEPVKETSLQKPVMPRRLRGLLAGNSEQMASYEKQMELYKKQLDRMSKSKETDSPAERKAHREQKTESYYDGLKKGDGIRASSEYKAVLAAMKKIHDLSNQKVDKKNTREFLEAHTALGKACKEYVDKKKGAVTGRGRERLELIEEIYKLQKEESEKLGEMREEKGLAKYEGRSFSDAIGELRTQRASVTEDQVRVHSGAMSQRYELEIDKRRGYFTKSEDAVDVSDLKGITGLARRLKEKSTNPAFQSTMDRLSASFEKAGEEKSMQLLQGITEMHLLGKETPEDSMKQAYKEYFGSDELGRELKDVCSTKEGADAFYQFMKACSGEKEKIGGMKSAGIDTASDMGKRNVATSRVAALFGIDHLIAHSESMELQVGTKKMKGVFMDQAIGYDLSGKQEDRDKFVGLRYIDHPRLQKQLAVLQAFDLVCGQIDRHPGNMLYQLDEVEGAATITGIQAIDSDMSFGMDTSLVSGEAEGFTVKHGGLESMVFMDKEFMGRMEAVTREDLDYALADVLSAPEIDALDERRKQVIARAKMLPQLSDEDWGKETSEMSRAVPESYMAALSNKLKPKDYSVGTEAKSRKGKETVTDKEAVKDKETTTEKAAEKDKTIEKDKETAVNQRAQRMSLTDLESEDKAERSGTDLERKRQTKHADTMNQMKKPKNPIKEK